MHRSREISLNYLMDTCGMQFEADDHDEWEPTEAEIAIELRWEEMRKMLHYEINNRKKPCRTPEIQFAYMAGDDTLANCVKTRFNLTYREMDRIQLADSAAKIRRSILRKYATGNLS